MNILGPSSLPIHEKIAFCEDAYFRERSDTVFKFFGECDADPAERALAEAGYHVEGRVFVMTLDLHDIGPAPSSDFRLETLLSKQWFDSVCTICAPERRHKPFLRQILTNITPPRSFGAVCMDGRPVSVGITVVERGWAGLFEIATALEFQRQGHATSLILNLLAWAKSQGARDAYLQVVCDNEPAIRLYEALGFRTSYSYWYRVRRFNSRKI